MDEEIEAIFEPDFEEKYTLNVTRNEAMYLDDTCTLMIEHHHDDESRQIQQPLSMRTPVPSAGIMVPYELIEKIGSAVLYTTDEANVGKEAEMKVSLSDLLMLREVAQSFVKIGEEPVGFTLKRKIAECLYRDVLRNKEHDTITQRLLQGLNIE